MVIDRYILKEILYTLLVVLFVLLIIFLSNRFVRFLADASAGDLAGEYVLILLGMKTLTALVIILPLGLFMAILLGLSRLYKDSEMIALAACGVSVRGVYRSVIGLALAVAAAVAAVSFYVAPWAEEQSYRMRDAQESQSLLTGLVAGRFSEPSGADGVMYFERLSGDGALMQDVFIRQQKGGADEVVLSARNGRRWQDESGAQYLVLMDGYRYEGLPGEGDFRIVRFKEHAVRIEARDVAPSLRKQRARPSAELIGSDDPAAVAELQWRVSMPLSVLLLALLAVPLSRTSPRQGKYAKLFVAVLIYLIYSNLLGVSNSWVARGRLAPGIGMWWVHLALLFSVWALFARQYGLRWVLGSMFGRRPVA
ncbi:MAG: LPS export ABC transporter permease LptF [Gammaproteobacteria bacterium]|nr:LPS export ABC transporter permease LptF [Gammaproteobacteria bacterium]